VLLGRKDLIEAALRNSAVEGAVCRHEVEKRK